MAESFGFVESGIILNTHDIEDINKHVFNSKDFVIHEDAYQFLIEYFDEHKRCPTKNLLIEKFPELDEKAHGENLDYCIGVFQKHGLTRKATDLIRTQNEAIKTDPKQAISNIVFGLDKLNLDYGDDIFLYDGGEIDRLADYQNRKDLRNNSKLKIIGFPTPLRTINNMGIGLMPGEICSIFARPGVGKSWFAIKAASICVMRGHKTLFVTSEMTADQMSLRFDVTMGKMRGYDFSHTALKTGDPINEEAYKEFLVKNDKKELIIVDHIDQGGISLTGVTSLIRKYRPEVVVIDNMELVSLTGGSSNYKMWEKMSDLYYGLKGLCTSSKIAAFVTHQATRNAANPFRPPNSTEVSSGDALLRASDIALSMCLVEYEEKQRKIAFQKFRDIGTEEMRDYVIMDFDVDCGIFKEIDESKYVTE